jgi:exocyst complex component 3
MDEIEKDLQVLPALLTSLEDLKEETSRHSQLATAQENLKHLFTVPETVRQVSIFENSISAEKFSDNLLSFNSG